MAKFRKGDPKPPNSGRRKGVVNERTKTLADMIDGALAAVGGQAYLAQQAMENPAAFLALVGKRMPKDINLAGNVALKVTLVPRE